MDFPIVCMNCGARGSVNRVTASLRCQCGSSDLDLDEGQQVKTAAPTGPGTGWGQPQDLTRGWSSYQGPTPRPNPQTTPLVSDSLVCPTCHGSGYDLRDRTTCRECAGAGTVHPTTGQPAVESYDATTSGPPVGGARWASQQREAGRPSQADPYGTAEYHNMHTGPGQDRPMAPTHRLRDGRDYSGVSPLRTNPNAHPLDEAPCPECGRASTELVKDRKEDAWWHCSNCGPLANIDKNPSINPYAPPQEFTPDRSMKTSKRLFRKEEVTGRVFKMLATIGETNPGLSLPQSLTLARRALADYPED